MVAMPIPIVAAQSAQPTNAWTRIVVTFLEFIAISFYPVFVYPKSGLRFASAKDIFQTFRDQVACACLFFTKHATNKGVKLNDPFPRYMNLLYKIALNFQS